MMAAFLVHIYVAAPGTPLNLAPFGASLPGHMFYVIENGNARNSYGLAPVTHGKMEGIGKVFPDDESNYQNPLYKRTLEITQAQYQKLDEFGKTPTRFGFSTYYQDVRNNCVDFTWAALNHAGIHATTRQGGHRGHPAKNVPRPKYEGSLKPTKNVDDIQTIQPPIPGSKLNTETHNPMPKQKPLHWLLSETNLPSAARRA
jgi:hypothetical protein